ncbi:MAG: response regulator transcription factor, partial [Trueperaceae bacterium]|nr:response regulator transcription factor [Trueperaceae bacterium]
LVDLIVLDLMLPEMDGLEIAKHIRRDYVDLPILMLTAKSSEEDKIWGLELGADDYVVKPFSPREVVARVRALLRRTGIKDDLIYGELHIHPQNHSLELAGESVNLTKLEFNLLLALAQHPGLVWSRDRLLERVWGPDFSGMDRVVDARIKALRKKLRDDPEKPRFIETLHGVGYRFMEAE